MTVKAPAASRIDGIWWWKGTPVPNTACWSAEKDAGWIAWCPIARAHALMMPERQGEGVPQFKNPHPVRQRRAMASCLCDLCRRPLRHRTKILAGALRGGARGLPEPATSEPLVCQTCYALAARHCPHVRAVAAAGPVAQTGPWIVMGYRTAAQIVALPGLVQIAGSVRADGHDRAACYIKLIPSALRQYRKAPA
jgi:hypothetical protein